LSSLNAFSGLREPMALKLILRTDAYPELGTGHLLRCLALAEAWQDEGGVAVFVSYCTSPDLVNRIKGGAFSLHELVEPGALEETLEAIRDESPDWIVLDGYHFDLRFQSSVKRTGCKTLVFDDFAHLEEYNADIIVNQNLGAERYAYNTPPRCRFLLGTRYTLLRREFRRLSSQGKQAPEVASNVLVTMGGVDNDNNAGMVIKALSMIDGPLRARVVAGFGNPNLEALRNLAELSRHDIEVLQAVEDMPAIMQWADVAVSAGGSTVWELLFMGVPAVLSIIADNQVDLVDTLSPEGFPSVGWMRKADVQDVSEKVKTLCYNRSLRMELIEKGRKIIDSRGALRVVEAMEQSC